MKIDRTVHVAGDHNLYTTLCNPGMPRPRNSGHMVLSAVSFLGGVYKPEFSGGRTYTAPHNGFTMAFCQECANNPDLPLLALGGWE